MLNFFLPPFGSTVLVVCAKLGNLLATVFEGKSAPIGPCSTPNIRHKVDQIPIGDL
jgi:hypothetical protein